MNLQGFAEAITGLFDWKNASPQAYLYHMEALALAAGANVTKSLTIQADANFAITELAASTVNTAVTGSTTVSGADMASKVLCQITNTGTGATLFSAPTLLSHIGGNAGRDRLVLPAPFLVQKNATLNVTFTNSDVNEYDIFLDFIGVKILSKTLGAKTMLSAPAIRNGAAGHWNC